MSKSLKITRVVTNIMTIPFGEDFYPEMTLEQAMDLELDADRLGDPGYDNAWMETFFDDADTLTVVTTVQVIEDE